MDSMLSCSTKLKCFRRSSSLSLTQCKNVKDSCGKKKEAESTNIESNLGSFKMRAGFYVR